MNKESILKDLEYSLAMIELVPTSRNAFSQLHRTIIDSLPFLKEKSRFNVLFFRRVSGVFDDKYAISYVRIFGHTVGIVYVPEENKPVKEYHVNSFFNNKPCYGGVFSVELSSNTQKTDDRTPLFENKFSDVSAHDTYFSGD